MANVDESGESAQHVLTNVGDSGESAQHGLANVGESGESCIFPKTAILVSTCNRQKRQVSREYLNSLNLLPSSNFNSQGKSTNSDRQQSYIIITCLSGPINPARTKHSLKFPAVNKLFSGQS